MPTTMNYPRPIRKKTKKSRLVTLILLFVFVGLAVFSGKVGEVSKNILNSVALPFWEAKVSTADRSSYLGALFRSRISQADEIKRLKEELLLAQLNLKGLEFIAEENRNLKTLLNREDLQDTVSASVLARPPQIPYDTFIIDIGKRHGLAGGEKVFFENVLIGVVEEVFNKNSKVRILSSSGVETGAFIERVNLPVVAVGRGGGNFEINLPQESEVEIGDFLVVPGSPQKLLGQIEEIEQTQAGAFKRVLLRFPINLSEIRWVAVEMLADN